MIFLLKNKKIPPSLNFNTQNPQIQFENSPFYVNTQLVNLDSQDNKPHRAGVSSFGMGGTNAHVILESHFKNKAKNSKKEQHLFDTVCQIQVNV